MGRDCFFSTGMEYRFAFAIQSSGDILLFGGKPFAGGGDYQGVLQRSTPEWMLRAFIYDTPISYARNAGICMGRP
jgi:hypothetical protein